MSTNTPRAIELAAQLTREWHDDALNYDTALNAADELRRLAAVEAERDAMRAELERIKALEPVAWISEDQTIGPTYGKKRYDAVPIQSLNPLRYKHTPLYVKEST